MRCDLGGLDLRRTVCAAVGVKPVREEGVKGSGASAGSSRSAVRWVKLRRVGAASGDVLRVLFLTAKG